MFQLITSRIYKMFSLLNKNVQSIAQKCSIMLKSYIVA